MTVADPAVLAGPSEDAPTLPALDGAQFAWTAGIPARATPRADAVMDAMAEEVDDALRRHFPEDEGFLHRCNLEHGRVRGRRFHVDRRGFRGTLSVMWYSRSHSYRNARDGGVEVRVGGRVRLHPTASGPPRPELDPHAPLRVIGLGLAMVLATAGAAGVALVRASPSTMLATDVLGAAVFVMMVGLALLLGHRSLRNAVVRWLPVQMRAPTPDAYSKELRRWTALGRTLRSITPQRAMMYAAPTAHEPRASDAA